MMISCIHVNISCKELFLGQNNNDVSLHAQVTVTQEHKYESTHETYSHVSAEVSASYGGLFYSGSASGGFDKQTGNSELTQKGSNLVIKFKVRKVLIHRPWLEPIILQYPTLGIKGLKSASWSSCCD